MKPRILVTRAFFPEALAALAHDFDIDLHPHDDALAADELLRRLQNKDGVLSSPVDRLGADVFAAVPQLKAVCNVAVGHNNIDIAAATAAGVMVTNTPEVLNETTADLGWALMMAAARRITEGERYVRAGQWTQWQFHTFMGADVHGSTLGIIGMGRIGQAIARRSIGFNMKVVYHNRSRLTPEQEAHANHAQYLERDELLRCADHVILVLPYSAATHHTIGARELSLMKPTATLTNIARGGIIDDEALIAALKKGVIAAAGLDVFENEPALHPGFLQLDNVALTPHIGSGSRATRLAMSMAAVGNLKAALSGQTPPNLLNPEVLTARR